MSIPTEFVQFACKWCDYPASKLYTIVAECNADYRQGSPPTPDEYNALARELRWIKRDLLEWGNPDTSSGDWKTLERFLAWAVENCV